MPADHAGESTEVILTTLRALLPRLRDEHGLVRLTLFGSAARGEAGPASDVDLLADFEREPTLFELARVQMELERALERPVDLIPRTDLHPGITTVVAQDEIPV